MVRRALLTPFQESNEREDFEQTFGSISVVMRGMI